MVDLDIAKFFDHVNHDILMRRIAPVIRDKRILRLIGRYLRAGVLVEGERVVSALYPQAAASGRVRVTLSGDGGTPASRPKKRTKGEQIF